MNEIGMSQNQLAEAIGVPRNRIHAIVNGTRDITAEKPLDDVEPEDARLAGQGLPGGTRLWAKSGDAYDYHHLVGRIVLPNGSEFILAVFTKGVKDVPGIIPRVYEKVAAHFAAARP